ncbi:MAG: hypothetical protein LW700_04630 [Gemmataceae bacterium]|nr:hypothetical protein [Gemmataceae bacterium]
MNQVLELGYGQFGGGFDFSFHNPGYCHVHVVPAEEKVVADSLSAECDPTIFFAGLNQTEIGGAAADVHHQNVLASTQGDLAALFSHPAIKGCLGFFQQ